MELREHARIRSLCRNNARHREAGTKKKAQLELRVFQGFTVSEKGATRNHSYLAQGQKKLVPRKNKSKFFTTILKKRGN